eukprot:scaffold421921_cov24-Prasinocladus_malaysianus.AAC.1
MRGGHKEASTDPVSTSAASREEGMLDLNDPVSLGHADIPPAKELNAAATKIQAVQKGRTARAQVATMRAGKDAGVDAPDAAELRDEEDLPDLNDADCIPVDALSITPPPPDPTLNSYYATYEYMVASIS